MVVQIVNKREPIDVAIKKFEAKCRRAQIYKIVRQKSYFVSKSEEKHRKRSRRPKARINA